MGYIYMSTITSDKYTKHEYTTESREPHVSVDKEFETKLHTIFSQAQIKQKRELERFESKVGSLIHRFKEVYHDIGYLPSLTRILNRVVRCDLLYFLRQEINYMREEGSTTWRCITVSRASGKEQVVRFDLSDFEIIKTRLEEKSFTLNCIEDERGKTVKVYVTFTEGSATSLTKEQQEFVPLFLNTIQSEVRGLVKENYQSCPRLEFFLHLGHGFLSSSIQVEWNRSVSIPKVLELSVFQQEKVLNPSDFYSRVHRAIAIAIDQGNDVLEVREKSGVTPRIVRYIEREPGVSDSAMVQVDIPLSKGIVVDSKPLNIVRGFKVSS